MMMKMETAAMKNGTVNRAVGRFRAPQKLMRDSSVRRRLTVKACQNRKSGLEPYKLANVPHESGIPEWLATSVEFGGS